jgi:hypothetical protein
MNNVVIYTLPSSLEDRDEIFEHIGTLRHTLALRDDLSYEEFHTDPGGPLIHWMAQIFKVKFSPSCFYTVFLDLDTGLNWMMFSLMMTPKQVIQHDKLGGKTEYSSESPNFIVDLRRTLDRIEEDWHTLTEAHNG